MDRNQVRQVLAHYERNFGVYLNGVEAFIEPEWRHDYNLAMDAQPTLISIPNAGIPSFLTTVVDPNILRIVQAELEAASILGEERKGDWTDQTAMFPVVEHTGIVSAYGDFENSGRVNANTNFPQRQAFLYQTIAEWGELEMERQGRAKINWASEIREAAVDTLNNFQNLTYFKGVAGLENYGLLTDPNLPTPLAPALKQWGGVAWYNGSVIAATANEIYQDIQTLFSQLVTQSSGNINKKSDLVLTLSPNRAVGLTVTNSFNVNVEDLLKKNFPNLEIISAMQYGQTSAQNPQGVAAGEVMQMIAKKVKGQKTGFSAFNEKLRAHPVIRHESSFRQKQTQGTWGSVLRQPFAFAQMIGI